MCYFGDEMVGDIWIPRLFADWSTVAIVEGNRYDFNRVLIPI